MHQLTILLLDKDDDIKDLISKDSIIKNVEQTNDCEYIQKTIKEEKYDLAIINPEACKKMDVKVIVKQLNEKEVPSLIVIEHYDDVENAIDALSVGAFDYFLKPFTGIMSAEDKGKTTKEIVGKILLAYGAKDKLKEVSKAEAEEYDYSVDFRSSSKKIIIIGCSTGGPQTLEQIIPLLPKNIPSPVIVVQHMPAIFTQKLADRLNNISNIKVKEAEDDEEIKDGICYIAKGDYHLQIKKNEQKIIIKLNQKERMLGVRPCINITMESAAKIFKKNTIGVILTGMGSDGTVGAKKIKDNSGTVIAQSERTSIIPSMPGSVIKNGYCDAAVDIEKIAVALVQLLEV